MSGNDLITDIQEEVEEFEALIHNDASHIVQQFKHAFEDVSRALKKPNVLIAGVTGAGKSSLINAVFGRKLAMVGSGKPITQHFVRYAPEDKPIVIYDSKGLEYGFTEEFIHAIREFIVQHRPAGGVPASSSSGALAGDSDKAGDGEISHTPTVDIADDVSSDGPGSPMMTAAQSADYIHIIWYVVNSAGARIQPFEERLFREVFYDVPIMFLLNKADISTAEERTRLREVLEGMKLENCIGIFDTISTPLAPSPAAANGGGAGGVSAAALRAAVRSCPSCYGTDFMISTKRQTAECENCGKVIQLKIQNGLEEVVERTIKTLPLVAREAFISAQSASFRLKDALAKRIITEYYHEFDKVRRSSKLLQLIAKMMTRLSILWDFREHGSLYGVEIARDCVSQLTFKDRVFLFFRKKKNWYHRLRTTVLGILWNRCVRQLALALFHDTVECNMSPEEVEREWPVLINTTFADLSEEMFGRYEKMLTEEGLEAVLEREIAEFHAGSMPGGDHHTSGATSPASDTATPMNMRRKLRNSLGTMPHGDDASSRQGSSGSSGSDENTDSDEGDTGHSRRDSTSSQTSTKGRKGDRKKKDKEKAKERKKERKEKEKKKNGGSRRGSRASSQERSTAS